MNPHFIDLILSGGFLTTLVAILNLRSTVRKAAAESHAAELRNSAQAAEILMDSVVTPLKSELNDTRNELSLLRHAINEARNCNFSRKCPVLHELCDYGENCPTRQ